MLHVRYFVKSEDGQTSPSFLVYVSSLQAYVKLGVQVSESRAGSWSAIPLPRSAVDQLIYAVGCDGVSRD